MIQRNPNAIGAVLGLVTSAATSITETFDAVGIGAQKLNLYASDSLADQQDQSKIHRKVYRTNLIRSSGLEQDKLELELEAHFAANPGSKERFDKIEADLKSVFGDA